MHRQDIPDIEIIDLDDVRTNDGTYTDNDGTGDGADMDNDGADDGADMDDDGTDDGADTQEPPHHKKHPINIHIVLLAVVVLTFGYIFYKYINFGQIVELDE
ncbi:MAG: hypothetical protein K2J60_09095, partial [Acetatifactor sp.]|nr:hypothetical protein [Acetatifactor sp.]